MSSSVSAILLALALSNTVSAIRVNVHDKSVVPADESTINVHHYKVEASSRCLSPWGSEREANTPVGDVYAKTLQAAIKVTNSRVKPDHYGPLGVFTWKNGCRSQPSGRSDGKAAQECGRLCDEMGSACEAFSLYINLQSDYNGSSTTSDRCCFGRMYVGSEAEPGAMCFRKDNFELADKVDQGGARDFKVDRGVVLASPLTFDLGTIHVKAGHTEALGGWTLYEGLPHCAERLDNEFPVGLKGDQVDASMVCRRACRDLHSSVQDYWKEPDWCEGFSVSEIPRPVDLVGNDMTVAYRCCFFTDISTYEDSESASRGTTRALHPMTRGEFQGDAWQFVAEGYKTCSGCEYDCAIGSVEGCACPGRFAEGTVNSTWQQAVLVGDVCSWCDKGSDVNNQRSKNIREVIEFSLPEDRQAVEECRPVDVCIDNEPGCEGSCLFNWKTLLPTCVCEDGFTAKGTRCVPYYGGSCDEGRDYNRCPVGTLNPCQKEATGRCTSDGQNRVSREDALSMCQAMKNNAMSPGSQPDALQPGKVEALPPKWSREGVEVAVQEKPDQCGKFNEGEDDTEYIWCCAEMTSAHLEQQLETGRNNFQEFQSWGPQVAQIASDAVAKAVKRGMVLANSGNTTIASQGKELLTLTGELDKVSSAYQIAISQCSSGKMQACASSGRGGVKGFAQNVRSYGRKMLAYTRRIDRIMDMVEYGTGNAVALTILKLGTKLNALVARSWQFVLRNKWKLLMLVVLSSYTLTVVNGMLATSSLQLRTNALVAQSFLRHVVSHIMCPLMKHPVVQGFMLKFVVDKVLFHPVVIKAIDESLSVMGPVRGMMAWWMKKGGATLSLSDALVGMKKAFGKVSVGIFMVISALGNTFFNILVNLLCGAMIVVTDVQSSGEKIGSEAVNVVSSAWDTGFIKSWNFLNRHLGSEQTAASVSQVESLHSQLKALQASTGQVPLQQIMISASQGLLNYESFLQQISPLSGALVVSTGVLYALGRWIGSVIPKLMSLMGFDSGTLSPDSVFDPNGFADEGDDESDDHAFVTDVQSKIDNSQSALGHVATVMADGVEEEPLREDSFSGLCSMLSQAERAVKKLPSALPREKSCPDVGNHLLGLVRPNEISRPAFKNVEVDIPPLW